MKQSVAKYISSLQLSHASLTTQRGFTIVELLIVIVVIGILAAITIVAYNGVQNRAKTSSGQSAAVTVIKKAELYNTENSVYPTKATDLTTGATGKTYELTGATFVAAMSAAPTAANSTTYYVCGTGATNTAPSTVGTITTITGARVEYWNFSGTATLNVTAGTATGLIGTKNVGCVVSNS